MSKAVLKLVQMPQQYRHEIELPESRPTELHSLHGCILWPEAPQPELAAELIHRFSQRGDVVLDPFARSGVFALQSVLSGRRAFAADLNPVARKVIAAKLQPGDLTEIALALQMINFRGPVDMAPYREHFSSFYDVDTYRELVNLRTALRNGSITCAPFLELLAMSLLHGHTAGYFSVYTFPQISLSPAEQEEMNIRRGQRPEHRSISARILRKTASVLRDGVSGGFRKVAEGSKVLGLDARQLHGIGSGEVQMVLTTPPTPFQAEQESDQWLRAWFSGVPLAQTRTAVPLGEVSSWCDYMNEALVEFARVVKPRGRVALDLPETVVDGRPYAFDEILNDVVLCHLGRLWDIEGAILYRKSATKSRDMVRRVEPQFGERNRVLVLKRR